jgi:hypothetical protein
MPEKFPIGSRVSGTVDMPGNGGSTEVTMKVIGYEGLKFVIVEVLADAGRWKNAGQVPDPEGGSQVHPR